MVCDVVRCLLKKAAKQCPQQAITCWKLWINTRDKKADQVQIKPIPGQGFIFIPPGNVRKTLVFARLQGVQKWNIDLKLFDKKNQQDDVVLELSLTQTPY